MLSISLCLSYIQVNSSVYYLNSSVYYLNPTLSASLTGSIAKQIPTCSFVTLGGTAVLSSPSCIEKAALVGTGVIDTPLYLWMEQQEICTVEPHYNEVLGTIKITLLYQVSHYIWVKKQRNSFKSWWPAKWPCYTEGFVISDLFITRFHCTV